MSGSRNSSQDRRCTKKGIRDQCKVPIFFVYNLVKGRATCKCFMLVFLFLIDASRGGQSGSEKHARGEIVSNSGL